VLEGAFDDLLVAGAEDPARHDYMLLRLTDKSPVLEAMARLRKVYPNALHLERTVFQASSDLLLPEGSDHRSMRPIRLFETFYEQVTGGAISEAERAEVESVLHDIKGVREVMP
jgi:exonuclease SbcD